MVTGGAGYIGAHVVEVLQGSGHSCVVVDDLSTPLPSFRPGADFVRIDLAAEGAAAALGEAMTSHGVDAVIHLAARKRVDESVLRPAWYLQQNVVGLAHLLEAMEDAEVTRLVFSSTAAVYGEVDGAVDETHPTVPINPYGRSKRIGEQLIEDAARAWGLSAASLRYFNVGGASRPDLGDSAAHNLIPLVLSALGKGEAPVIFGDDYPTPDGTCVRDFVHVADVADAHIAALEALGASGHGVYNIGTGRGTSVREIVELAVEVSGADIEPVVRPRRAGDPASVVAVVDRIATELGWRARRDVAEVVESTWRALRAT